MYLYGRTQMVPQFSIVDAVPFFMKSGFDGVEISCLDKQFHLRDEFFAPDFAENMSSRLSECGVKGYSVSAHLDYTSSDEIYDAVRRVIEIGKALDSKYVIINGAIRHKELEYEAQMDAMMEKTAALAEFAENTGIRLAVEYEPGFVIDNTAKLLKAFKEINSPAMGINCDIGHYFLCESDPFKAIEDSREYILQCHVENMAKGVHNHLVPWEGDMDLPAYVSKLREVGFNGGLGLDLYAYEYADVCAECAEYFRKLI